MSTREKRLRGAVGQKRDAGTPLRRRQARQQAPEQPAQPPGVLTPPAAARYLGLSDAVLRLWRKQRKGPPFFKAGEKLIRYRRLDLDAWITERVEGPSS